LKCKSTNVENSNVKTALRCLVLWSNLCVDQLPSKGVTMILGSESQSEPVKVRLKTIRDCLTQLNQAKQVRHARANMHSCLIGSYKD